MFLERKIIGRLEGKSAFFFGASQGATALADSVGPRNTGACANNAEGPDRSSCCHFAPGRRCVRWELFLRQVPMTIFQWMHPRLWPRASDDSLHVAAAGAVVREGPPVHTTGVLQSFLNCLSSQV